MLTAKRKTKWHVDHLEDGKIANVNDELEMHNKCKGVPKCNMFAEIIFGYTDERNEMKAKEIKPSTLACEAYVIFTSKTG